MLRIIYFPIENRIGTICWIASEKPFPTFQPAPEVFFEAFMAQERQTITVVPSFREYRSMLLSFMCIAVALRNRL